MGKPKCIDLEHAIALAVAILGIRLSSCEKEEIGVILEAISELEKVEKLRYLRVTRYC